MFSEKSKKNADACRFCWMCRHLCPVQLVTGKETNTPRAKGLLVSMITRGMKLEADTAETMYECMLCGACTNDCVTGFEPPVHGTIKLEKIKICIKLLMRRGLLRSFRSTLFQKGGEFQRQRLWPPISMGEISFSGGRSAGGE